MKELENKEFEELIGRIIEAEREIPVDPLLAERVMTTLLREPEKRPVSPFYVRLFPYFVKAACIVAALVSGVYLGTLSPAGGGYQDNSGQLALHDGYIEGLDVLLNE